MNKDQTLDILKTINYPGFNRDIVSFGMVKDISIDGKTIVVNLNITSQNEEKKSTVIESVKNKLADYFEIVSVELTTDVSKQQSPPSPSEQRPITESILSGVKHVIAVASGKGGVGKSTVAANLACGLVHKNLTVGLLDLDIYGPSLPIILGINEQPKMTQDRKLIPLERYAMKVMSFGFISGNDTPTIWRGPLVSRMTEQFFRDVEWGKLDYLILDLPPGTGDIQLTLTQKLRMTGAIIVTTPQDIALADVRKGADMFRKVQTPVLGVVENMSGLLLEGSIKDSNGIKIPGGSVVLSDGKVTQLDSDGSFKLKIDLFKQGGGVAESNRLGVPLLGQIPIAIEIMESTDAGEPIVYKSPESSISQIYLSIVDSVLSVIE